MHTATASAKYTAATLSGPSSSQVRHELGETKGWYSILEIQYLRLCLSKHSFICDFSDCV